MEVILKLKELIKELTEMNVLAKMRWLQLCGQVEQMKEELLILNHQFVDLCNRTSQYSMPMLPHEMFESFMIMAHPFLVSNNQNEGWEHFLNLVTPPWRRVFENDRNSIREITMEFLATFIFQQTNLDYWDENALSFRLGGSWHSTSIELFGIAIGIYTEDEIYEPTFSTSTHSFPDEEDINHPNWGSTRTAFWNKVVRREPCNIANLFCRLFATNSTAGVNTPMFGNGWIVQLYENNDEPTHGTEGPSPGLLDLSICASMGMITYLPDGHQPPPQGH
ncbi:hypothetical protein L1987_32906 [Smallanthus sonchifolius]|uniref:Uncharacterized protein n=1 Tax=Smallanthus sonchifolius TaxID=185202 RepID=A0ACB9HR87_9ASTR|nr:hypothetical protein L1987_32906 [Smallanthus sonchifolius]